MIGAILGDIVGSRFEWRRIKDKEFDFLHGDCQFTDDTVLTIAIADCILNNRAFEETIRSYALQYPNAGYGSMFHRWVITEGRGPYNSFGNGSAMRVSPIGFVFASLSETLEHAERSAAVTHNHPEGIKGAQATAASIFLARTGKAKEEIRKFIATEFSYNLDQTLDDIRPFYRFDETCQGSVPQAIIAFLESTSYEDAVRNAVSLGGDSDTLACIAGGIAEAFYKKIPEQYVRFVHQKLDDNLRSVVIEFERQFGVLK